MSVRRLLQKLQPIIYPFIRRYYSSPRWITKRGIRFRLLPSVFHPSLYHSTDVLLDHALTLDLEGKKVLELGCGSGFVSLFLAKDTKATVHASDISETAVSALRENAKRTSLKVKVFHSDLFENLPANHYDVILINPPYYFLDATSADEFAFYVGKDGIYLTRLFAGLKPFLEGGALVLLVVSEDVKNNILSDFSKREGVSLHEENRQRRWGEDFIIYSAELI